MAEKEVETLKKILNMDMHPNGGMFKEMWRGKRKVTFTEPSGHDGPRDVGSSIYFLLSSPNFVAWQMLQSDELLYWHAGGTLKVHLIDREGNYSSIIMGNMLKNTKCVYQVLIPHDTWNASEVIDGSYVLYSAAVAPGWDLSDHTTAERDDVIQKFPQHKDLLKRLTKE